MQIAFNRVARARLVVLALAALAASIGPVTAADTARKTPVQSTDKDKERQDRFVRVTRDKDDNPVALQTAIRRFVPADKSESRPIVDLIGAVHVADAAYYQQLNKEFEGYDAVLYELVAPTGVVPKKGQARSSSIISSLQNLMKDVLDLAFQLDGIDYEKANFVHADMSPDEFSQTMKDRGETPIAMFFRILQASAAMQAQRTREPASPALALKAFFDKENGPSILKRIVADELSEADTMLEALNGETGSTIITERNKKALKVLRDEIDSGKKKIAIFYGSGHMSDMEKRLVSDFKLQPKETRWLTAWDLKDKPAKKSATPKPKAAKPSTGKQNSKAEPLPK